MSYCYMCEKCGTSATADQVFNQIGLAGAKEKEQKTQAEIRKMKIENYLPFFGVLAGLAYGMLNDRITDGVAFGAISGIALQMFAARAF